MSDEDERDCLPVPVVYEDLELVRIEEEKTNHERFMETMERINIKLDHLIAQKKRKAIG